MLTIYCIHHSVTSLGRLLRSNGCLRSLLMVSTHSIDWTSLTATQQ